MKWFVLLVIFVSCCYGAVEMWVTANETAECLYYTGVCGEKTCPCKGMHNATETGYMLSENGTKEIILHALPGNYEGSDFTINYTLSIMFVLLFLTFEGLLFIIFYIAQQMEVILQVLMLCQ